MKLLQLKIGLSAFIKSKSPIFLVDRMSLPMHSRRQVMYHAQLPTSHFPHRASEERDLQKLDLLKLQSEGFRLNEMLKMQKCVQCVFKMSPALSTVNLVLQILNTPFQKLAALKRWTFQSLAHFHLEPCFAKTPLFQRLPSCRDHPLP